jgi:hypothetical protein
MSSAAVAMASLMSACSTTDIASSSSGLRPGIESGTPSVTAGGNASSASSTSAPPFEQIIRGAERQEGLLPTWRRQDRVWIELDPKAFGKPLFLSPRLTTGIGEAGVFGGLMQSRWAQVGRPQWVEFRKVNQQVQLVAINATYTAQSGTPQALAVASAFSPSLLSSVPLASAPRATSGAVLIDANALLLTDMLGMAQHLQRSYRQSYGLDNRNSALTKVEPQGDAMLFEVSQHFATSGISAGGSSGSPGSSVPLSVPDPRSLFVTVQYTLTPLPERPMPTRPADARVGYFNTTVADFTNDLARTPRLRHINKWRLEQKDPAAPMSEPVQPIVYWLDPSIPDAYRAAIKEGVLMWNKAFEAIGYRNAIEVRMPPSGMSPNEEMPRAGHASIRWMTNSQPGFGAIGPTHVDPRTGEILHAHIALESLSSRAMRTARSQLLGASLNAPGEAHNESHNKAHDAANQAENPEALHPDVCQHGFHASDQLGLALDVLAARGEMAPDSPQVQSFVLAYLKDTTMHEVGHTLGLRHNFRGSRWRTAEELNDPMLGKDHGNSASVMDYAPINLPLPGQRAGEPFQTTLGPYDFWAIEYGYKPLPADPAQAEAMLRAIAQRSADPEWIDALAYGTDEDNFEGLDPQALAFDLGRDPIAYARARLTIVRDLFERLSVRQLQPEDDPSLLRRSVGYGMRDMARTGQILSRQIGGILTRRDRPGGATALLTPLPAARQRTALRMLTQNFLSTDVTRLPPSLLRRLAPDYLDRQENNDHGLSVMPTDFSWADQQLTLQRQVLATLMNPELAERLLDNIDKTRDIEAHPLTPEELHRSLRQAIWNGQARPTAQDGARRNLQREHVNRLATELVHNSSDRADVRALLRNEATLVLRGLRAKASGSAQGIEAAHRRDCIDTLSAALSAQVVRLAP